MERHPKTREAAPESSENSGGPDFISALDNMVEGLQIIGRDWRYLYVNDAAAAHGRRPRDELIGHTMMECYPGIETTAMFRKLDHVMQGGEAKRFENKFAYPDGATRHFDLHFEPVQEGVLVLSLDVTERIEREDELRRRREELAAVLRSVSEAVVCVDEFRHVVRMNPAAEELFAVDPKDSTEKHLHDLGELTHPTTKAIVPVGDGAALQEPAALTLERADGTRIPVLARETRLHGTAHGATKVVVTLRNLSTEHSLQHQLRHAQKMEAIGRLAGGVAHDFNNLLTAIITLSTFIEAELEPGPALEDLNEIVHAARRAEGLTRQLLTFSRRRPVQPELVDINDMVRGVRKLLRGMMTSRVQMKVDLEKACWPVLVDPGALEQVLMNLAINALDAMPKGGRLTIETTNTTRSTVQYGAKHTPIPTGDYVLLSITDEGVGMSPQTLDQAFDPFFTTKQEKGTGLGLSTCYGIIQQADGYISVSSECGIGTSVRVYLPRADASAHDTRVEALRPRSTAIAPASILVAELDEHVRLLVSRALARHDHRVLVAADANEAGRLIARYAGELDLLITDIVLPGLTAPPFAEGENAAPIGVLFTAGDMLRHREAAPHVAFIHKPFGPDDLLAAVADLLAQDDLV
jgi:signal transduction histidine kinase/CheY-like chemotaxis protein